MRVCVECVECVYVLSVLSACGMYAHHIDDYLCMYNILMILQDLARGVASNKLQVSFAEYSLFSRALLQKRPIILSIWRVASPPTTWRLAFALWGGYGA